MNDLVLLPLRSITHSIDSTLGQKLKIGRANEEEIPPELIQMELEKWVKRSTAGSFISLTGLITWVVVFQLNKDSFGPGWFVMSQEEDVLTGW